MKHAPQSILSKLRWLYIAFSAHFIIGYIYTVGFLHKDIDGGVTFSAFLAAIATVHLIYELVSSFVMYPAKARMAATGSFLMTLLIADLAIQNTGVYLSPYALAIMSLTILAGAYSQYMSFAITFLFVIGFVFDLSGVFKQTDGGPVVGGIFMGVNLIAAGIGYLFWRRYYSKETPLDIENLSKSLKSTQVQANIVLQSIEDGVVLIDARQIIQLFNPAAATTTGWTREEAQGLDWRSVFKFVDEKGVELESDSSAFGQVFKLTQTIRINDAHILTKSGKDLTIALTVSPLLDDAKQVTGAVGIFRDVSEERQEEAQRAEFISTASHEMRTPVAAIEGYLSLALNDKVATIDTRARDYLQKAHASTQHLGQLFQDLLTSAKAEDGRLTSHPKIIEMGAYLDQLTQDLRFAAQKKSLAVDFVVGNSDVIDASQPVSLGGDKIIRPLYYIQADPDRLREVITNLFDNAVKYTDAGKISLGLTGNDDVVQFYIRDTGAGIPADDIPHLFQKFYRVDNSATRTIGGTGLGLFISRKIVELYQGRIWVESAPGKGSTFYINLPRISTQRAEQLQVEESAQATQTVGSLIPQTTQVAAPPAPVAAPPAPEKTAITPTASS